jgi:catechol 2,3-dioxygenase-like lactoylglutathione lyase family enzyme
MLGEHPVHVVLLSRDLAETREFYHDKLGLEILDENEAAITFRCGGDTSIAVTKSTTGTADEQTQAGWFVPDLASEVAELVREALSSRSTTRQLSRPSTGLPTSVLLSGPGSSIRTVTRLASCS